MLTGLLITQALNGLQLGVLLFLLAAGLTLVFGIMNFVNLTHGSIYMLGAYFGATAYNWSGSFTVAVAAALVWGGFNEAWVTDLVTKKSTDGAKEAAKQVVNEVKDLAKR